MAQAPVYQLPTVEVELKGVRYQLTALPSNIGEKALVRLIRNYGPVFSAGAREQASVHERHLMSGADPAALKGLADVFASTASMEAFCAALNEEDFAYFATQFKQRTEIWAGDGYVPMDKRPDLEGGSFTRNYGLLFLLLKEHLVFNFEETLKDLTGLLR